MSKDKLFLPILLGTTRRGRESENAAKWLFAKMQERQEIETQLFDVRDFDLPNDDYGTEIGGRQTARHADGKRRIYLGFGVYTRRQAAKA